MMCALLRRVGVRAVLARQLSGHRDKLALPRQERLPDGTTLTVDFMTSKQVLECYRGIKDEMRSGIGFHSYEYEHFEDWQRSNQDGHYIGLVEPATSAMVGGIVLNRCAWTRLPQCGEGIVVVQPAWRRRGLGHLAIRLALEFSVALGYRSIMADPYSNNKAILQVLRAHGFSRVGAIPTGMVTSSGEPVQIMLMLKFFEGAVSSPSD